MARPRYNRRDLRSALRAAVAVACPTVDVYATAGGYAVGIPAPAGQSYYEVDADGTAVLVEWNVEGCRYIRWPAREVV